MIGRCPACDGNIYNGHDKDEGVIPIVCKECASEIEKLDYENYNKAFKAWAKEKKAERKTERVLKIREEVRGENNG